MDVARLYDRHAAREHGRLDRHRTEFAVTLRALRQHLPPPPATVLDVGGGPGRYAVELARQGYAVTLVDLSAECLALARADAAAAGVALAGVRQATATDLGAFASEGYDAALLLGPLYHLPALADRRAALREARRVLAPGGLVAAAFLTRYAPIWHAARFGPERILEERAEWQGILTTGIGTRLPNWGAASVYFAHPGEIAPLLDEAGFEQRCLVACEGIVNNIEERVNQLAGAAWEAWVDLNYELGQDPAIHGAATHLLWVGQKPPPRRAAG